jgi:DNA-binding CsgD family transcriptional regulator
MCLASPKGAAMLGAAGLNPAEEHVYRLLIGVVDVDLSDLARTLTMTAQQARQVLKSLETKGLVSRSDQNPPRYAATAPDVGFGPLLLGQHEALETARDAVAALTDEYRSSRRRHDAGQLIEVIIGAAAIRQQIRNLQLGARTELLWFCRAGHVAMPAEDNVEEFDMLKRGVKYRVIYERALLEEPGMIANVAEGIRHGEQARATSKLPIRLAIADRNIGLCPLVSSSGEPGEPSAALVHDSNLLSALVALFEKNWVSASPVRLMDDSGDATIRESAPDQTSAAVQPVDRYLLSLLLAGVSDKAIATQMGVSLRTVQRRVRAMMRRVDAESRMQLAWHAAPHSWI